MCCLRLALNEAVSRSDFLWSSGSLAVSHCADFLAFEEQLSFPTLATNCLLKLPQGCLLTPRRTLEPPFMLFAECKAGACEAEV